MPQRQNPSSALPEGRIALFVGHPGHELCVHAWLARVRPIVFVLTDGGGRTEAPRLDYTTRLLRNCGATPAAPYGRLSDTDLYRALRDNDHAPFVRLVEELTDTLLDLEIDSLVSDPADGYNPAHDVCRLLAGVASARARRQSGRTLRGYEYLLLTPAAPALGSGWRRIELSDAELARKRTAALAYAPLRAEVQAALDHFGPEAFRAECFRQIPASRPLPTPGPEGPSWERHGERQVAAGHYSEPLRYARHLAPLVGRLRLCLEDAVPCAA